MNPGESNSHRKVGEKLPAEGRQVNLPASQHLRPAWFSLGIRRECHETHTCLPLPHASSGPERERRPGEGAESPTGKKVVLENAPPRVGRTRLSVPFPLLPPPPGRGLVGRWPISPGRLSKSVSKHKEEETHSLSLFTSDGFIGRHDSFFFPL